MLLGFEIDIGDRKLAGAVVERSEAERRYEDAITDGGAAMLLEQAWNSLSRSNRTVALSRCRVPGVNAA